MSKSPEDLAIFGGLGTNDQSSSGGLLSTEPKSSTGITFVEVDDYDKSEDTPLIPKDEKKNSQSPTTGKRALKFPNNNEPKINSDSALIELDDSEEGGSSRDSFFQLPTVINLEDTFWFMKQRQWSRLHRATFGKARHFEWKYVFFYLLLYIAYLVYQLVWNHKNNRAEYILEYLLMGLFTLGVGWFTPLFGWVLRWILLEGYLALGFFFVLNMYSRPTYYLPLLCVTGGLFFLTIINFNFYPIIVRAWYSCTGGISPKVEVADVERGIGRYEIEQTGFFTDHYKCVFEGKLVDGKPHGLGTWIDTSFQGELLRGYWKKGIPIGPFESIENDTRNMFVNLQIIYGTNGGGTWWLQRTPLAVGIGSIETCVSGHFFKDYPIVNCAAPPIVVSQKLNYVKDLLDSYTHIDDDKSLSSVTVTLDSEHRQLNITGFQSTSHRPKSVTITLNTEKKNSKNKNKNAPREPVLELDRSWIPSGGTEGILFVHGINHTLEDALKRFGQFLALGHFPPYIKPFIFNWPASTNPLLYWCAQNVASDNDTHKDLRKFIKMLQRAGIRTLHIMCHSMGTRFFLRSFHYLKDTFLRRKIKKVADRNNRTEEWYDRNATGEIILGDKIQVRNMIFLNPDYEMDTFFSDYDELRQYSPNITIYADSRDQALKVANQLNRKQSLGLVSSHKDIESLLDGLEEIDIVDTADLDRNMNSQFHGYFNINRVMVDDLWELIVTGKRAESRTSRLKPFGGVFRFTIVPSTVVMV